MQAVGTLNRGDNVAAQISIFAGASRQVGLASMDPNLMIGFLLQVTSPRDFVEWAAADKLTSTRFTLRHWAKFVWSEKTSCIIDYDGDQMNARHKAIPGLFGSSANPICHGMLGHRERIKARLLDILASY